MHSFSSASNYHLDREALAAALEKGGMGYLGMIGSKPVAGQVGFQR
jgi:xanthine/CO dehydrogenase XdhC/CoxF family maturation factor